MVRNNNSKKSKNSPPPKVAMKETKKQPSTEVKKEPKQPGLLAQAAATAGGVAVGNVIGKSIADTFMGSSKSNSPGQEKCSIELKSLFDCYKQNKSTGTFQQCENFMESLYRCFNPPR